MLLEHLERWLIHMVGQFPWALVPWARALDLSNQRALIVDLLNAAQNRNPDELQECLEDWQATVDTLQHPEVMQVLQQPDNPTDDVSWEDVRIHGRGLGQHDSAQ